MTTETLRIELATSEKNFLEVRAANAGYASIAKYVRALLVADQKRELARLEDEVLKGIRSGESTPVSTADWDALRERVRSRQHLFGTSR